jgi:hypothetical protein
MCRGGGVLVGVALRAAAGGAQSAPALAAQPSWFVRSVGELRRTGLARLIINTVRVREDEGAAATSAVAPAGRWPTPWPAACPTSSAMLPKGRSGSDSLLLLPGK